MQIWLDTADIEEIRETVKYGVISGITTNPSLAAKAGHLDLRAAVIEICSLVDGPVNAEVLSLNAEEMIEEGREIATWAPNVVVKVPIGEEGLQAISVLSGEGIAVNQTLTFSVNQALLGALAGATYISPFVGRLDDAGNDGMVLVSEMAEVFKVQGLDAKVLAASLRHPQHVVQAALAGAHVATLPYKVFKQMFQHPLTDIGLKRFIDDWRGLVRV
jgi:transaldolase